MWTYKTCWCPIGSFHDWQECIYAHNYQDYRRDPRLGYSTLVCPDWEKSNRSPDYKSRCPRGFACGFAHGAKEQLYHPGYFRSVLCNDHFHGKRCPRGRQCAFFHKKKEKRNSPPWPDHGEQLPAVVVEEFLQPDVEFPPFAPPELGGHAEDAWAYEEAGHGGQEWGIESENWSGMGNAATWWGGGPSAGPYFEGNERYDEFGNRARTETSGTASTEFENGAVQPAGDFEAYGSWGPQFGEGFQAYGHTGMKGQQKGKKWTRGQQTRPK
jgi:hypothetical protein